MFFFLNTESNRFKFVSFIFIFSSVFLDVLFRTFDVILQWRQNMCHVIFHVWGVSWRKILYFQQNISEKKNQTPVRGQDGKISDTRRNDFYWSPIRRSLVGDQKSFPWVSEIFPSCPLTGVWFFFSLIFCWKYSILYLGPKNLDTFWCTGWVWNCQIIFRFASIHGRAHFIS